MFIVFEGGDGSGKSTQLQLLADLLVELGYRVTTTREPGGSKVLGPLLREVLLTSTEPLGDRAEALLFAADRAEHVRTVVEPALARGEVVLCDRYEDSTLAYQGRGRGLPLPDLEALTTFAAVGRRPDLVVVCDVSAEVAAARQGERGAADRMEQAGLGAQVRELLLERAAAAPDRYAVVDGSLAPAQVAAQVADVVVPRVAAAHGASADGVPAAG